MAQSFEEDTENEVMGLLKGLKDNEDGFKKMMGSVGFEQGAIDDPFNIDMDSIYGQVASDVERDPETFRIIASEAGKSGISMDDEKAVGELARKLYAKYQD